MENPEYKPFVDFGDVLRYYRNKAGLSQEQLAEGICTRMYVSQIEKNKQIPTLYMVSAFSNKMGVNLFDAYALITEHNDFDTHRKIEQLHEAINAADDNRMYELAMEYASLPGFSSGAPLQCIKHAFALYFSNVCKDYEKSIAYATEGLAVSGVPDADMTPTPMLSVTDLCLLLAKSVDLCRSNRLEEGRKYLEYLHECARLRLIQNRYIANRNLRFDINLYSLTTFNICEFFPDDIENNMKILIETLDLLYDHKNSNMQGELQLYQARYLYETGDMEGARRCFNAGYYLLACRQSEEYAEEHGRDILEKRFDILFGREKS